jgi:hypothetical protein
MRSSSTRVFNNISAALKPENNQQEKTRNDLALRIYGGPQ